MNLNNPVDFLLNRNEPPRAAGAGADPVAAPAFSVTKVLSSAAVIVAPLSIWLVDQFSKVSFTSGQIVALTAAILGFLAIASAADVLGRAISASAASRAKAITDAASSRAQAVTDAASSRAQAVTDAASSRAKAVTDAADARAKARTDVGAARSNGSMMLFAHSLTAQLISDGRHPKVAVLAAKGGSQTWVLVDQNGQMSWVPEDQIYFS